MTRSRTGKTLIEMVVIVSLLAVVFAGSTTTLAALFRIDRQLRRDAEQSTSLSRLSARFRADVHEATNCRVQQTCVLTLPDSREIHYAAADREITREVRRDGKLEHRDGFRLPAPAGVSFTQLDQADGKLVRLTIRPSGQPATGSPTIQATTIDAALDTPRREVRP